MIQRAVILGLIISSLTLVVGFILWNKTAPTGKSSLFASSTPAPSSLGEVGPSPSPSPSPTPNPTPKPTQKPTPKPTPAKQIRNMEVTFYRWDENGNPGNGIAYPHSRYPQTLHEVSSGIGSFNDPVSIATNTSAFPPGARMYAPYIQKYLIVEDICPECDNNQIDIWLNSDGRNQTLGDECAGKYTRDSEPIEINPPAGRAVNTSYLFDPNTGTCH